MSNSKVGNGGNTEPSLVTWIIGASSTAGKKMLRGCCDVFKIGDENYTDVCVVRTASTWTPATRRECTISTMCSWNGFVVWGAKWDNCRQRPATIERLSSIFYQGEVKARCHGPWCWCINRLTHYHVLFDYLLRLVPDSTMLWWGLLYCCRTGHFLLMTESWNDMIPPTILW